MYGRTYDAHRYSPLNQINTKNVNRLIPVWTFQTGVLDGFRVFAACNRRHHVSDDAVEPRLRDRLQDRLAALALSEIASAKPGAVL